jgi:uncharacterized protein YgfB (UPF0149 family)
MIECFTEAGRVGAANPEAVTDIDYDRIGQLLTASALSPTPGEAHGMLCGLVCGGSPDPGRVWLDQLLSVPEPPLDQERLGVDISDTEVRSGLDELLCHTLDQMQGPRLGFDPFLPDDSRPLAERATALYDWVRGFLFALGVLGLSERDLSEQTREVFRDFVELTRMDLDDLDEGEDNEKALAELTELVWVAAMLVYEERAVSRRETK